MKVLTQKGQESEWGTGRASVLAIEDERSEVGTGGGKMIGTRHTTLLDSCVFNFDL